MSYLSNFFYQVTGPEAAPKLVFLHGVMGFAANFRRIARAFENEYQVLVYDQRGHGRSFKPETGYGPEDYAGDLVKILDELGWSEIRLVGHSMGGRVAFHFASQYPQRVTQLVISDIGPSIREKGSNFILNMLEQVPVPFASRREAKEWFDTRFLEIHANHPKKEQLAAYLYANLTENEQDEAVWRFSLKGVQESVSQGHAVERWDEIEKLSMPTLLVRGERSTDLPRDVYERMLATNPRIEGIEIPDAGHWVHSDQPDFFIEALRRFFLGQPQSPF